MRMLSQMVSEGLAMVVVRMSALSLCAVGNDVVPPMHEVTMMAMMT